MRIISGLTYEKNMDKYGYVFGYLQGKLMLNPSIKITPEVLNLITKIDEFKGEWK